MKTKAGKDLEIGDKVIHAESGQVVTIASLTPGFMTRKSRLVHFEELSDWMANWTIVYHDDLYEIAEQPEEK